MKKSFGKILAIAALGLVATTATAQQLPTNPGNWEYLGPGLVRGCDASACYTYWDTGGGNWILINVEPREPRDRHEN